MTCRLSLYQFTERLNKRWMDFEIFEVRETQEEESRLSSNGPIRMDRRSALSAR